MPLTAHSSEVLLIDLIQTNISSRTTCRITVSGPDGEGMVFLRDGEVVHAEHGGLSGRDAFRSMVSASDLYFNVEMGIACPRQTIRDGWRRLSLETLELLDARPPQRELTSAADSSQAPRTQARARSASARTGVTGDLSRSEPAADRDRVRSNRPWWPIAAGLGVVVTVVIGLIAITGSSSPSHDGGEVATQEAPALPAVPVEATDLTEPGDAPPRPRDLAPVASPDPTAAVRPTVVCRVLVDAEGRVQEAKIYRSRLDLALFEEAALDAVTRATFAPARRGGQPVPAWTNVPITFN
jgi:TonB family protein